MEKRIIKEDGKEKSEIICDMCFKPIPKEHMKCCKGNRGLIQINTFDCQGHVKHYCRDCSALINTYICDHTYLKGLEVLERGLTDENQ